MRRDLASGSRLKEDEKLIASLSQADLILISAAPWNDQATLYKHTALSRECFPPFSAAVGMMGVTFLDADGQEVTGAGYTVVGLGYEGFRQAAAKGAVILVCGGRERRHIALAALRGKLVSVLVTTQNTAEWIVQQDIDTKSSAHACY